MIYFLDFKIISCIFLEFSFIITINPYILQCSTWKLNGSKFIFYVPGIYFCFFLIHFILFLTAASETPKYSAIS